MANSLMKTDPRAFRHGLIVDCGNSERRLGDALDPWQRDDFEALDPAWKRAIGLPAEDGPNRAWLERPRGASKTSDIACMVAWALFAAPKAIRGLVAAADRDQAALLRDAVQTLCRANPWLGEVLDIQSYRIIHKKTKAELLIISKDSSSAYGHLVDFIVCDELTHWTDAAEALWIALFSTLSKRQRCLGVVITNAGTGEGISWQWKAREAFRTNPRCYFHALQLTPSWVTEEQLAEQQRVLPPIAYDRLYRNFWTTGSGDALNPEDIAAAVRIAGPIQQPQPGFAYAAGLDLGLSRDNACLSIVGRFIRAAGRPHHGEYAEQDRPTGQYRLAHMQVWKPQPGKRVKIGDIENAIVAAQKRFRFNVLAYDPWQSDYLAERLGKKHFVKTRPVHPTAKNLQAMASALVEAISERSVDLWDHDELLADLRNMRIEEKGGTWKLKPVRDGSGHGDRAISLALALMAARKLRYAGTTGTQSGFCVDLTGKASADVRRRQWNEYTNRLLNWN